MNAYEQVHYPCHAYRQTLPSHLSVIGRLYGLNPAPPDRCRVLEVGCGDGGNLLPMAWRWPESRFHGIDLAPTPMEHGRALAEEAGIRNLVLECRDLRDVTDADGTFDYIIAHGFFSWVPEDARRHLLELCGRVLSPHGIAFVSYNAWPGAHVRQMLREILLFHCGNAKDFDTRVEQARAMAGLLVDGIPDDADDFATVLKSHAKRVLTYAPQHFFHDDLAEISAPYYLHEFVSEAVSAGLQYLGDADFRLMHEPGIPETPRKVLARIPDRVIREQYFDFLRARRFRQSLICRADAPVAPVPDPNRVPGFWFGLNHEPEPPSGSAATDSLPGLAGLAKRIVDRLSSIWPDRLDFATLRREFDDVLRTAPAPEGHDFLLCEVLLEAFALGMIHLFSEPAPLTTRPGTRPKTSDLARAQLRHGSSVTNLLHTTLRLSDEPGRHLVSLLDGTRDHDALVAAMTEWARDNHASQDPEAFAREQVDAGLSRLARLALLVRDGPDAGS